MACSLGLLTLPQPKTTTEVTKQEALAYEGNEWSTGQQVGGKGEMWKSLHRPSRGRCGYAHGKHPQPFQALSVVMDVVISHSVLRL